MISRTLWDTLKERLWNFRFNWSPNLLEIIHTDIYCSLSTPTLNGHQYFILSSMAFQGMDISIHSMIMVELMHLIFTKQNRLLARDEN